MTEDPRHPERLVPWLPPDLRAAWRAARDLDVAAAGRLGGRAVAWLPGDGYRARPPGVAAAALLGEAWPVQASFLYHLGIQTHDRMAVTGGDRARTP